MRNIRLTLEYDGTFYHGWQRQPGVPTIQKIVEDNLSQLLKEKIRVIAAGRTDARVHAQGQVINFVTHSLLSSYVIKPALNSYLPKDIRIKRAEEVSLDFHAQSHVLNRIYRYIIYNHPFLTPFYRNFTWQVPFKLEIEPMQKASHFLIGEHDFSSFQAQGSPTSSPWRRIEKITLFKKQKFVIIYIKANSFLYKMARNIVGTLAEIGRGSISPSKMKAILAARDRKAAGPTAPPQGLCLVRVHYKKS